MLSLREGDPQAKALEALSDIKQNRWQEVSLGEDARLLGQLIKRFGFAEARTLRQQLTADQTESFLREHALCRDIPTALTPPKEPLEEREQAHELVKKPAPAFLMGAPTIDPGYEFLLTLPNRTPLDDAKALVELRKQRPEEEAQIQLRLQKTTQEPEKLKATMTEHLGEFREEDLVALGAPLPDHATLEQGVRALAGLHSLLPPNEARRAYAELLHSLKEGAWAGQTMDEGVQRLTMQAVVGDYDSVLRCLASAPLELSGGAVTRDAHGVTVGGVRLRTR
jgi:hypothetical protein